MHLLPTIWYESNVVEKVIVEEHRLVMEVQTLVVKEHNYGMEELILVMLVYTECNGKIFNLA